MLASLRLWSSRRRDCTSIKIDTGSKPNSTRSTGVANPTPGKTNLRTRFSDRAVSDLISFALDSIRYHLLVYCSETARWKDRDRQRPEVSSQQSLSYEQSAGPTRFLSTLRPFILVFRRCRPCRSGLLTSARNQSGTVTFRDNGQVWDVSPQRNRMATVFKPDAKGPCAICGEMVWSTEQRCKTLDGRILVAATSWEKGLARLALPDSVGPRSVRCHSACLKYL